MSGCLGQQVESRGTSECQDQQWSRAMEEGSRGTPLRTSRVPGSDVADRAGFEMGKEDARGQLFRYRH